jgi:hypothetical protein
MEEKKDKNKTTPQKPKPCIQHDFEYYGFPIASKRCKVCGYEKM